MNEYIELIVKLFERQFSEAYRESNARSRKQIFPFISAVYRRWYYSALVEATPLTPANIIASINAAHDNKTDIRSMDVRPADIYPTVVLRSKSRWSGLQFNTIEYSSANHPVTSDLRTVIEYCSPSIDLIDEDCFTDEQALAVAEKLSMDDPHYASYLLEMAFRMRLINKIPSIYANMAQVAKDAESRLAVSNEALFDEIVEATIRMSSSSLSLMIPLPEPVFTESFIRGLLKEPMITDDIFECVYDTLGFSLDDLFDEDLQDEFDGFDATLLSGTFMTGLMLDKFFFTPFSYFLKLIRPIYVLPFDFQQEFKYFYDTPQGEELSAMFYAPCSKYHFTELGLKYFNIKATPENYADAASFIPFDELKVNLLEQTEIMDKLPLWAHEELPEGFPYFPVAGHAFTFKIKLLGEPAYWIHLDIGEEASLHRLYQEITRYFYFARNEEYSFFHGEAENPFTEYALPRRTRKVKNNSDIPLSELDFEYSKTLLLLVHNQGDDNKRQTFRLKIEYIGEKQKEPRMIYPLVSKMSKAIRQLHEDDNDFIF